MFSPGFRGVCVWTRSSLTRMYTPFRGPSLKIVMRIHGMVGVFCGDNTVGLSVTGTVMGPNFPSGIVN